MIDSVLTPALFADDGEDRLPRALELLSRLGLEGRRDDPPTALAGS